MHEAIASDLSAVKTAFGHAEIPWVVMGGVALGFARYNDIMAWDTDLDVGVFVDVAEGQWQRFYRAMRRVGFRVPGRKADYVHGRRRTSFEVWFYHKNGEFFEAFPTTTPGMKFVEQACWYEEPQIVDFVGSQYPMPKHIEAWAAAHYGEDWRTNIVKDHAQYFQEKRGNPRNVPGWIENRKRKDGRLWWPALLRADERIEDLDEV